MKKQIIKVINNLKHMFARRYINMAIAHKINKNGVICFY